MASHLSVRRYFDRMSRTLRSRTVRTSPTNTWFKFNRHLTIRFLFSGCVFKKWGDLKFRFSNEKLIFGSNRIGQSRIAVDSMYKVATRMNHWTEDESSSIRQDPWIILKRTGPCIPGGACYAVNSGFDVDIISCLTSKSKKMKSHMTST